MDIWTTLVQLRKCNTSHASKWKESIALSVFRGSKVPPWALRFRGAVAPGAGLSERVSLPSVPAAAASCHRRRAVAPAFLWLSLLSVHALGQPHTALQGRCRRRERLALNVTQLTSFCGSLTLEPNSTIVHSTCATHRDTEV